MFELLMRSKGRREFVPDSGPGTEYLTVGTNELGFMGEVQESELMVEPQLLQLASAYSPYTMPEWGSRVWLKFRRKSRSVYVPLFQFPGLSANAIADMQVSFNATDYGTAKVPATTVNGKPMWKSPRIITSNSKALIVRLFSVSDTSATASNINAMTTGELFDLLGQMYDPLIESSYGYKRNPAEVLFPGNVGANPNTSFFVMQQAATGNFQMSSSSLNGASLRGINAISPATVFRWWPVLEYINSTELAKYAIDPSPVVTDSTSTDDAYVLNTQSDSLVDPLYIHSAGLAESAISTYCPTPQAPAARAIQETVDFVSHPRFIRHYPRAIAAVQEPVNAISSIVFK